jgi:hypothetical protein
MPQGEANLAKRPRPIDRYLPLDVLLALEELAGFVLSNRPSRQDAGLVEGEVVLIADRFPALGDPLVDFARSLDHARIEAAGRPQAPWLEAARELEIAYREDEGLAARLLALVGLWLRHPVRCARDVVRGAHGEPSLSSLAPAAARLERQRTARIHPLGGEEVKAVARRLSALSGRHTS